MRPHNDNVHRILQIVCDASGIVLAWAITVKLRSLLNGVMWINLDVRSAALWAPRLDWILELWLLAALWLKIYSRPARLTGSQLVVRATESWILVVSVTIITTFFSRGFGIGTSRSFVLMFGPVCLATLMVARMVSPMAAIASRRWAVNTSVAVMGAAVPAARMADRLSQSRFAPEIKGVILPEDGIGFDDPGYGMRVLGTSGQLAEVINRERLDQIIVLTGSMAEREFETCSAISRRMGITVSCSLPAEREAEGADLRMDYGVPLLEFRPLSFTRRQEAIKGVCDVAGALALLVLSAPLMLVIAILIKATSKGPVLHIAPRVGKGGRYFMFLKFRSMVVDTELRRSDLANEKDGHIFKIRNDPRITPLGRFLRRYSLDELAQLFNVLRGEMSLVGPRPLPAEDLDPDGMSRRFANWSEQRSHVRPGITGLWQVRGRSALSFEDMMRLDTEYIRNWSLRLDLQILLETPVFVLTGHGAF
jgi:exopolysaccharide biosynthesis polyprenyl glycosylphosphotransferase